MHFLCGREKIRYYSNKIHANKKSTLGNTRSYLAFGSPVALRPEMLNE